MNLVQILTWIDDLEKKLDGVKEWLASTDHNFIWIVIFFVGILVFAITYRALNKDYMSFSI